MRERMMAAGKHTGCVVDYEAIREEARRCEMERQRAEQTEKFLQRVPLRFRKKTFTDFQEDYPAQVHIKRIVERYVSTFSERLNTGNCMILLGRPGTGKTMLSLIAYEALARKGYVVGYEPSLQFLRRFKEKEFESDAAFHSLLEASLRISLLVIDEITEGVGRNGFPADWERKMLFTLINARYEKNLCCIAITNRSREEMMERLGEPIVDRLSENGLFLAFNWNSYRKPKGENHACTNTKGQ